MLRTDAGDAAGGGRWDDGAVSCAVAAAVTLVYAATFASVPTSDGAALIAMIDATVAAGQGRMPIISNAPFSYYLPFVLRRAALAAGVDVSTLAIFQALNAGATGVGCAALYRALRLAGGPPFWALVGTGLVAGSYAVWYFANGEVHSIGLALLLVMLWRLMAARRRPPGAAAVAGLVGLGILNALAVFFHQEHFLFGWVGVTLLIAGRPWRRGLAEAAVFAAAGAAATFGLIVLVGRLLVGALTLPDVARWYFWQLGYLAREYEPEAPWLVAARVVKGQLTAFLYGVQILMDAARDGRALAGWTVRALAGATLVALALAGGLLVAGWRARRRLGGDARALALGAVVWLLVYPALLSWYFPAVTEYYLKTVPALVLLLVVGPIAGEASGRPGAGGAAPWARARAAGMALLALVVVVNAAAAIAPWYRYGLMREHVASEAATRFRPTDLAISLESGIDAVLAGKIEQLALKNLLYREGKARGFAEVRAAVAARLDAGGRVYVYNLVPGPWALAGLNAPTRNPHRDRYAPADFEALLADLRERYDLAPALRYWEEARDPLYLFGRRLETLYEVRARSGRARGA